MNYRKSEKIIYKRKIVNLLSNCLKSISKLFDYNANYFAKKSFFAK